MESVGAKWWVCSIFFSYPSIADFEITLEKKIPSLDETRAVLKIIKLYSNILDKNKRRAAKSAPPGRLIKILIRQKLLMYGNFQFFWKNLWYAMPITKTFLGQRQNIFQKTNHGAFHETLVFFLSNIIGLHTGGVSQTLLELVLPKTFGEILSQCFDTSLYQKV